MGRLEVGLRIMLPWIGLFTALVVAAQVTLTAAPGAPQSPDVTVGRGALLPIIPVTIKNTPPLLHHEFTRQFFDGQVTRMKLLLLLNYLHSAIGTHGTLQRI